MKKINANGKPNDIHVCFSTDDNYAPYCGVAIQSMLMNKAQEDHIRISILFQTLSADNMQKLKSLGIPFQVTVDFLQLREDDFRGMPIHAHFTVEAYFRLAIPRLFPEIKRMLYLDSDILVRGSLWELFTQDIKENHIGIARDSGSSNAGYNTGVLLYDCEKWRQNDVESIMREYLADHANVVDYVDQSAINYVLKNSIYPLSNKWNHQIDLYRISEDEDVILRQSTNESIILHYASFSKPWQGVVKNSLTDEYFEYLKMLPWALPDHGERNNHLNPQLYYIYYGYLLSSNIKRKIVSGKSKVVLLYETSIVYELVYAIEDIGIHQTSLFSIKEGSWIVENPDFIFILYHNYAIVEHIMKFHGYDITSDSRIIMFPESLEKPVEQLLAQEYIEFSNAYHAHNISADASKDHIQMIKNLVYALHDAKSFLESKIRQGTLEENMPVVRDIVSSVVAVYRETLEQRYFIDSDIANLKASFGVLVSTNAGEKDVAAFIQVIGDIIDNCQLQLTKNEDRNTR